MGTGGWRLCLLAVGVACFAATPDTNADRAYDHFYNLEYDEAIEAMRLQVRADPNNPRFHNDLAQALLYREIFHSGAMESELVTGDAPLLQRPNLEPSPEIREEMDASIVSAFEASKQRLAEDPEDTEALFELGVTYAARANVHFFVRKAWYDGLRDVAKARQLHDKVTKLDPSHWDAALTQGAHDYLISQLPLAYKIVGSVLGFRGNRKRGIATIETVSREGQRRRVSAQMLLSVIYRREEQPELAVPVLLDLMERFPRNYLFPLELAQMYADAGDMAMSMETLDKVEKQVEDGAPGFGRLTAHRVRVLRGHTQFRHGRLSEAVVTLRRIVEDEGATEPNIRALAWLKLGQAYDLLGQRSEARSAYLDAINSQPVSEAARQSRLFLLSPYHEKKAPKSAPGQTAAEDG